jgi:hypothetical protein
VKKYQYRAIHTAITAVYGKPNKCENKKCNYKNPKRFEWSNKNHKYNLIRKEWWMLCVSCHRRFDFIKFGRKVWNRGVRGLQKWHNISGLNNGTPWNKGKKTGLVPRSAFKNGNKPWNKK